MVASLVEPSTAPLRRRSTRLRWISLPWTASLAGGAAVVRGACPEDALSIRDMVARCSGEVRHQRFLGPVDHVGSDTLADLLTTDVGFVARDPAGRTVGVANLGAADPRTAELAVVVEDAMTGVGLEQAMLGHLVASAHLLGFRAAVLRSLPNSVWAQRALGRLGPIQVTGAGGGPRTIRLRLSPAVMAAARGTFG
jgi:N-acetylglutamate synthase-like GNAT family acetyltransferase